MTVAPNVDTPMAIPIILVSLSPPLLVISLAVAVCESGIFQKQEDVSCKNKIKRFDCLVAINYYSCTMCT